ncbi:hypothetical protein FOPG_20202 [Fusarium oxysporum f. sp. conglutinans race 2 54008]|uniref:Uncharacterized protein n=1 Tax=Fusarium oxysporum f. sp. conglutinans race 2 54008 TaxID=1089457 RepID=X0HQL9_FUSOX|nr:hypothetical protein FOPG_20202 [Fusarium oxysporum f. sp. conglutinans race 2 54008]
MTARSSHRDPWMRLSRYGTWRRAKKNGPLRAIQRQSTLWSFRRTARSSHRDHGMKKSRYGTW